MLGRRKVQDTGVERVEVPDERVGQVVDSYTI